MGSLPGRGRDWNLKKLIFILVVLSLALGWITLSFYLSTAGLESGSLKHLIGAWATSGLPGLFLLGAGIHAIVTKQDVGPTELVVVMPGTGPLTRRQLRNQEWDQTVDAFGRRLGTSLILVGLAILIPPLVVSGVLLFR